MVARMWETLEPSQNLVHVAPSGGAYLQYCYLAGGSWVLSQPGLPDGNLSQNKNKTNDKNHYTCILIVSLTIINKQKHPNSHPQYWYIYTMEYCCTLKKKTKREMYWYIRKPENIVSTERSRWHSWLFMTVYVKCLEWASHRKQSSGCQRWGGGGGMETFLWKEENVLPL